MGPSWTVDPSVLLVAAVFEEEASAEEDEVDGLEDDDAFWTRGLEVVDADGRLWGTGWVFQN